MWLWLEAQFGTQHSQYREELSWKHPGTHKDNMPTNEKMHFRVVCQATLLRSKAQLLHLTGEEETYLCAKVI